MERVHSDSMLRLMTQLFSGLQWQVEGRGDKLSELHVLGFSVWQSEAHPATRMAWPETSHAHPRSRATLAQEHMERHRTAKLKKCGGGHIQGHPRLLQDIDRGAAPVPLRTDGRR